jgi:hypothetical protein
VPLPIYFPYNQGSSTFAIEIAPDIRCFTGTKQNKLCQLTSAISDLGKDYRGRSRFSFLAGILCFLGLLGFYTGKTSLLFGL